MWLSGWFFILAGPVLLVFVVLVLVIIYVGTGTSFLDFLSVMGKHGAKLTCWHCGKETPANQKRCKYCKEELQ